MVVLRETITQSCEDSDVGSSGGDGDGDSSLGNDFQARAFRSQQLRKSKSDVSYLLSPQGAHKDWRTAGMLVATLSGRTSVSSLLGFSPFMFSQCRLHQFQVLRYPLNLLV